MLPTTPAGHFGSPRAPRRIGAGGRPSRDSAARAQARPAVNSRRLLSAALAMAASSAGNSVAPATSPNTSAAATWGGTIFSIIRASRIRDIIRASRVRDIWRGAAGGTRSARAVTGCRSGHVSRRAGLHCLVPAGVAGRDQRERLGGQLEERPAVTCLRAGQQDGAGRAVEAD